MWLLRLLAVILVVAVGAGLLIYAITGKRQYLAFSWRLPIRYCLRPDRFCADDYRARRDHSSLAARANNRSNASRNGPFGSFSVVDRSTLQALADIGFIVEVVD